MCWLPASLRGAVVMLLAGCGEGTQEPAPKATSEMPAARRPVGEAPAEPDPSSEGPEEFPPIYMPPPNGCGTNGGGGSCGAGLGSAGTRPFPVPGSAGVTLFRHPDGRTLRIPTEPLTAERLAELDEEGWEVVWRTSGWSLGARPR